MHFIILFAHTALAMWICSYASCLDHLFRHVKVHLLVAVLLKGLKHKPSELLYTPLILVLSPIQ